MVVIQLLLSGKLLIIISYASAPDSCRSLAHSAVSVAAYLLVCRFMSDYGLWSWSGFNNKLQPTSNTFYTPNPFVKNGTATPDNVKCNVKSFDPREKVTGTRVRDAATNRPYIKVDATIAAVKKALNDGPVTAAMSSSTGDFYLYDDGKQRQRACHLLLVVLCCIVLVQLSTVTVVHCNNVSLCCWLC